MLKHHPDALVVALAVTPRDEDLNAHGKAHRQGGEDEIVQSRHHGSTQLVGAEVTKESGISEGDDGLRKVAQHDGVCDAPNLAVGNGGFNHVTKLGNSSTHQNQFSQFSNIFLSLFPKKTYFCLAKKRIYT